MSKIVSDNCQCRCGDTKFTVSAPAITRFYCHCTICQEFNNAPFSDVVIYRNKDVFLADESTVEFNTYKAPPAVQRGKCKTCDKPAIEFFTMRLLPALVFIPAEVIGKNIQLPDPACHLFYNRRHQDHIDKLPKHSGYLKSQLALTNHILKSMLHIGKTTNRDRTI
jgi:hypothetical protein